MTDTLVTSTRSRSLKESRTATRLLTPREVERRYPELPRSVLARRRMLAIPPEHEVLSGTVVYAEREIERFLAKRAKETCPGAPERCQIYLRADSLYDPPDPISEQLKACEEHQRRQGWKFAATCIDFGPPNTSRNVHGRAFWCRLLEATLGDYDILLTYEKSHISTDPRALRAFEQKLAKFGVRVVEVKPRSLRCAIYARVACQDAPVTARETHVGACRTRAERQGGNAGIPVAAPKMLAHTKP